LAIYLSISMLMAIINIHTRLYSYFQEYCNDKYTFIPKNAKSIA
jgi:hypothetical protein